ncbi:beta-N-acetylhexosaminidase [Shewanella intestini]|uniref:Beta-hexosaminidase n=1 Tax=Shewanella intestini TaxID=2017544 RepID=A0ABS5HYZ2_9GAMM|nr:MULTISPECIES: beta-N-acetylhexosaminidase [Shewanella]MBR9727012.1 beta-N-acetylhexosaminidase [Shewanella intestini]MRG35813.1 beta-N-acetylhexosaminidase [Shewanella sp. XMDDZSB0408]
MSYLMMDLAGLTVSDKEAQQLQHPQVGGIILFSRNYQSKSQLIALTAAVRKIRSDLIIAVDHEGGRVQRFVTEFTKIPAMGHILPNANNDINQACEWASELGFVMAIELLACDIDLSFAPVLDINGVSDVIGLRSFSDNPKHISLLADAWIKGMNDAGMSAVGKHFPGHGSVKADSHVAMAVDSRSKQTIFANDLLPFEVLIGQRKLAGVMPAHVVYDQVDPNPAGFSSFWLQDVLRQQLGFDGVIFSDDLGMKGASFAGDYIARAQAALKAGCDMILVCNDPDGVETLLTEFSWPEQAPRQNARLLRADQTQVAWALEQAERWQHGQALANKLGQLSRE